MSGIVLFDGVCNFCNGSVNFIIARDREKYFRFAPLQSDEARRISQSSDLDLTARDSIILIEDGEPYFFSTAAIRIARRLNGRWPLFYVLIYIPEPIRDFFYKIFARYRYGLFGKKETCMVPTPQIRERFLE